VKNLRIAFIAPQPFVENRATPMANLRIAQILVDAGHTVDVITLPFGSDPEYPGIKVCRCRPIPFARSVGIGFSLAKLLLDVNLAFRAFALARRNKFDCIHAVEEGAFIGLLLSRLAGVPLVYDMDSVMSHEIARSALRRFPPAGWLIRAAERLAIRNAALVVTISDGMAEYIRRIDPSKDIVIVPDIPISIEGADANRARVQMPCELIANRKIIMYAGSLANYQGLDLLVSAMAGVTAHSPEVVLVIVGGDEKGIKRLAALAKGAGVKQVLFMGKKPPDQIPDFLSAADVLVSPRRGGLNPPAKIYTYMQSGKPVVATDIPAHTTVLGRDAAVLVEATPEGIAEGILWALAHPEEADRRAARARRIVSEVTPDLQARRVQEGYERLAAGIEAGRKPARGNVGSE